MDNSDVQGILSSVEDCMYRVLSGQTNGLPEQLEITLNDSGKTRKLVILVLEVDSESNYE